MSSAHDESASIHSQLQSRYFTVPSEIRDAIYRYLAPDRIHLFMLDGEVQAKECVKLDKDDDPDGWSRRAVEAASSTEFSSSLIPFYRRLHSSWATHWRCKEDVRELFSVAENGVFPMVLLITCKRLILETYGYMADHVIIHFNDMDMVEAFVSAALVVAAKSESWLSSSLPGYLLLSTKELHIDLRLPLKDFEAFEKNSDQSDTSSRVFDLWMQLSSTIQHLAQLRRLRIWLDHDAECSWSAVNERAMLAPISSLNEYPDLDVNVSLPKLHPKLESAERHYTDDSPKPAFAIHRRYRQRYHLGHRGNGTFGALWIPDFPITYELEQYGWTMEQVEQRERRDWRAGLDPLQFLRDLEATEHKNGESAHRKDGSGSDAIVHKLK